MTRVTDEDGQVGPRKRGVDHTPDPQNALVIHPLRPGARDEGRNGERRLQEAIGLAAALDLTVKASEIASLREISPATLFGRGKVETLARSCEEHHIDVVVVDDALTPGQQRNLENRLHTKVIDRTGLILEIFGLRARTREGRLQVELARLGYEKSRLVRTWTHLERQRGGFGVMGGPGETQIETDRRLLAEKIGRLKRELEDVRRTRGLHRAARRRTPFPTLALVGYTNAGKSTLFNRLTESKVDARDLLFATLDPTLRVLKLPDGRPAVISDTVGFISDLPHELVAAFRATLEEVEEADLILHVRDVASESFSQQGRDVEKVLASLDLDETERSARVVEVWNKVDRLDEEQRDIAETRTRRSLQLDQNPAVLVSAVTGQGCSDLLAYLSQRVDAAPPADIILDPQDGEALAWLYRHGRVLSREESGQGEVHLSVKLDPHALGQFQRLYPGSAQSAPIGD